MIHTEEMIVNTISALKRIREEQKSPVHAILYGSWGTGKTFSSQKIVSHYDDVFYIKIPDGDISKGRLYRLIGLALRSGVRHTWEGTLNMIKYHLDYLKLKPVFILDESQRILAKYHILNELKDLSEDLELNFSYIFLGDHTIPRILATHPHSIHKRIVITRELQPITENTIDTLAKELKVEADVKEVFELAKRKGWTTIDVAFILQGCKQAKQPARKEFVEKLAVALGR
jgi:Cdc6-like AAA superfamily ATPase